MKKLLLCFSLVLFFWIPQIHAAGFVDVTIDHLEVEFGNGAFIGGILLIQPDGKFYALVKKDDISFKSRYAALLAMINNGKLAMDFKKLFTNGLWR